MIKNEVQHSLQKKVTKKPLQKTVRVYKSGIDLLSHPQKGSTIGANGLNFSVRNGKRWSPVAIATLIRLRSPAYIILREIKKSSRDFCHMHKPIPESLHAHNMKPIGLLVLLGFDITAFTPTAYRRGSLPRPSREVSSWG